MRLAPILYTEELEETIAFYTEVLAFTCTSYQEEWGWARLESAGIEIMISLPNDHLPFEQPFFTGSFYIYVNDVQKIWDDLDERIQVAYPLEVFDHGMKEFAIYDNNGYILQFGEEAPVQK
jgi:uncharacterized glyoxalase superfamily protein PhnB